VETARTGELKMDQKKVIYDVSRFTDYDIYLFKEGSHLSLYDKMGSHIMAVDGKRGTYFAVWVPNADSVSVIGDFNGWNPDAHFLRIRDDGSGIFEGFIPGTGQGTLYKYHIRSKLRGYRADKGDPFAFSWQVPPDTSSLVWDLQYDWDDSGWMKNRHKKNSLDSPVSIYEVHLGSWRRNPDDTGRFLTYREIAPLLADYVNDMGFTHVEFMPVMEHPFYGSWGYQCTGYFAPSRRYGTPQDFMYLIDYLHRKEIGVILDWVPSHFPDDIHGLVFFDGTYLYEHADKKKGYHPEWKSYIFNYGRNEVRNFLLNSALFWMELYHADGLRVDAVASMLYLDYGRKEGEWIPNEFGGKENIEAIGFLRKLNEVIYEKYPDVQTIAEESTAWPMVSRPTQLGGLGFGMKWNMGWMHDTLEYFASDPVYRKYNHNRLTFSLIYAFHENFVLSLSHDEVVYGKRSLIGKMPGDDWQKFANLRLLFGYMYCHPGKKLIFMGGEFGQPQEWNHDEGLHWDLMKDHTHFELRRWVRDLNLFLSSEPALYERDFGSEGFEWIDTSDSEESVISFVRKGTSKDDILLVVCNMTPVPRHRYRVGVPRSGSWKEILNSDAKEYGGSGQGNFGGVDSVPVIRNKRYNSVLLTLPPLGIVVFRWEG
jgi:1,4-alpha-glucan branching enzyme